MQFETNEPWLKWNSTDYQPKNQYDAWNSALNDSHLKWSLDKPTSNHFNGAIKMRHLGGIRLLYCDCDPCRGKRTSNEIKRSNGEYFGVLYIYEGSEIVAHGNEITKLKENSLLLWDSRKLIKFELLSRTRKVTLLVPQDRLRIHFPKVDQHIGKRIDCSKGLGIVTASHIYALGNEANFISKGTGDSIVDLTLELISTYLQANMLPPISKAKQDLLDDILRYINLNLANPELSPSVIANAFNISTRYLHLLFSYKGNTVCSWILDKRLEQCRRQLLHINNYKDNITTVAYQWGFNDSSHFSKVFKKKYGISPSEYQRRHFNKV